MDQYNNCWIVTGPESSGSVLIAKTLSYALKRCSYFGEYSGYCSNSDELCENYVFHRSVPYHRPKLWHTDLEKDIKKLSTSFKKINYILTTRDKNISILSKIARFQDNYFEASEDYNKSIKFFKDLASNPNAFIWNYETMLLLNDVYFKRLYEFFGIVSTFTPEIYDANKKYTIPNKLFKIANKLKLI